MTLRETLKRRPISLVSALNAIFYPQNLCFEYFAQIKSFAVSANA
jgi:hypothetical protein